MITFTNSMIIFDINQKLLETQIIKEKTLLSRDRALSRTWFRCDADIGTIIQGIKNNCD